MEKRMNHLLIFIFIITPTFLVAKPAPLETVPSVNVSKYLGTWHEIARLPVFFQLNCYNATATYDLMDEITVKVTNRCETKVFGKKKVAYGKAEIVDTTTNSKLLVSFKSWFQKIFPELAKGDYWILELGKDYSYAVVGAPSRKFLWFLSRSPDMDKKFVNGLKAKYRNLGFPTQKMKSYLKK